MRPHLRQQKWRGATLIAPGMLWIAVFLLVPLAVLFGISFFSTGSYGETERPLTLEHYGRFLGFGLLGWDPLHPFILARSLWLAALSTFCCLALGLPLAFFIAALPARWKTFALTLVIVPLWTNLLIRTYAWQMLLAPGGWLSNLGTAFGLPATTGDSRLATRD